MSKKSNKFLNDPFHYSPLRERDHPSRPKTSEIKNEPTVIYLSAMCKLKICEETMLQMRGREDISLFRQLEETCSMYKNQLSFDELLMIEKNIKSLIKAGIICSLFMCFIYVLFSLLLKVQVPEFILFSLANS